MHSFFHDLSEPSKINTLYFWKNFISFNATLSVLILLLLVINFHLSQFIIFLRVKLISDFIQLNFSRFKSHLSHCIVQIRSNIKLSIWNFFTRFILFSKCIEGLINIFDLINSHFKLFGSLFNRDIFNQDFFLQIFFFNFLRCSFLSHLSHSIVYPFIDLLLNIFLHSLISFDSFFPNFSILWSIILHDTHEIECCSEITQNHLETFFTLFHVSSSSFKNTLLEQFWIGSFEILTKFLITEEFSDGAFWIFVI
jgi:hypothetical protein